MKKTPLYDEHKKAGGKMIDFAGWELPVLYESIMKEHTAVRTAAGLFDTSHMGEIVVKGDGAELYLRMLVPSTMAKLEENKCMYTCFCNDKGGVIDDLIIYKISKDEFYLVVNATTLEKDLIWLKQNQPKEVELINVSEQTAKIDLQGPRSLDILKEVFDPALVSGMKRFHFVYSEYQGKKALISRTGYTGEQGYEFYIDREAAPALWKELLEKGASYGLMPAGLGARDSLRLEACYSLYGHELCDEMSPLESGIGWLVNSGDPYVGKGVLEEQQRDGTPFEIIALELTEKGVPREDYQVLKG
ncbi:MAG: glycine cleavage system aminomethyltransferase GcvT, partial [bacterium]|nr:glycine cleavage system aminomethyltransferase GcvT [bacterium]